MKLIYGFGINDADYVVKINETVGYVDGKRVRKQTFICPFYRCWIDMLARVCGEKQLRKNPTYFDCYICEDWIYFSNFKAWMESQDWEDKQLDKDILSKGNKLYSPDTCVFVNQKINKFILENPASRGEFPIGVSFIKRDNKFDSKVQNPLTGKTEFLGYHKTPEKAHEAWLTRKLELAKLLAAEQNNSRVAEALVYRYENYEVVA